MDITSFLPGLSAKLCGSSPKPDSQLLREQFAKLGSSSLSELSDVFREWIPASLVESQLARRGGRDCFSLATGALV